MFAKLVCPLDGSRTAEIGIPYLEEIAAKFGSEITLVSVCDPGTPEIEHLYLSYLEGIGKQVEGEMLDYGLHKGIKIHTECLSGKPAKEILQYTTNNLGSLIVMASRGSSGQSPWLLGNIAAKVLRTATQPMLLIRAPVTGKFSAENKVMRKILVPLDGSERGAAAIPYVEALAEVSQAEIVLYQVIVPSETHSIYGNAMYYSSWGRRNLKNCALTYLDSMAKPLKEAGLKTSSAIDWGSPADSIIDYAESNAVDLIAMSTHGRTGIGRWVFGSVTDKVLHAGETAVLVVRAS